MAGSLLPAKLDFLVASGFNLCRAFRDVLETDLLAIR